MQHYTPAFHPSDAIAPVIFAVLYIALSSLLKEPNRRNFNAIMIGGAGAAYLSGGGLGAWEFVFTAVLTYCAYQGLNSYRFIGLGWLLHTAWDLVHHFYGNPIVPILATSSAGCAITDALLAGWFFANAPSVFDWRATSESA
jgi:Family of unknown function (DUF6010)